jgi:integrase
VKPPRGRAGRPSKSFTVEQAKALLVAADGTRWHAYVALSLLSGIRTEEARALRWDHVVRWMGYYEGWQPVTSAGFERADGKEERYAIYVWRAQRHGGDTKTGKQLANGAHSRRLTRGRNGH